MADLISFVSMKSDNFKVASKMTGDTPEVEIETMEEMEEMEKIEEIEEIEEIGPSRSSVIKHKLYIKCLKLQKLGISDSTLSLKYKTIHFKTHFF